MTYLMYLELCFTGKPHHILSSAMSKLDLLLKFEKLAGKVTFLIVTGTN